MVPEFISSLNHADPYFRESSSEILGLIGDSVAVEPLAELLNDPVRCTELVQGAQRKLAGLTLEGFGQQLVGVYQELAS